jgi:two-component system sensor histidine kinase BaeS
LRRRLTIAISLVILGTLVLTVGVSVFLIQRSAISSAEDEVTPQVQALADLFEHNAFAQDLKFAKRLKQIGSFDTLNVVGLSRGEFTSLPTPLSTSLLDVSSLLNGDTVSGNVGHEVFAAIEIPIPTARHSNFDIPAADETILVVTLHVKNATNGIGIFLLVAGAVLIVGAAVAALLARKISAPILEAVSTTGKIASGDLSARVPVHPRDYPELRELAESINRMGENLDRSEGLGRQFLLSVSHELRTPLTSIRGYADAVADGATEDIDGALTIIGSESRRLERLVTDLLDLARLDARQFSLRIQRVDAAEIVSSVATGFRPEAESTGIGLDVQIPEKPEHTEMWVDADPDRLAQIVANLIENAFKFAQSRVVAGATRSDAGIVVWVMDDGRGISTQDLPHVFERHFTSDRASARNVGSGLGLAIVSELAGSMGARCSAESPIADGTGTRMSVWLDSKPVPTVVDVGQGSEPMTVPTVHSQGL